MLIKLGNVLLVGFTGVVLLASSSSTGADGLTVGLLLNTERAFGGYTLFTPINEGNAYLIDNAGRAVHSWDKGTGANVTPYLLEDGSVIRVNGPIGITQHAWDGSLVWDFDYPEGHHDIEVLPNGNVLLVAKEIKTAAEAIAEGRDPGTLNTGALESETIVEVRRTGPTSGEIVWEWRAWDHLIQDFDPTKDNYAVVGDHPELIDINFGTTSLTNDDSDWLHANSVDYNPELDQIVVSVRQFGELWIIDHSTTTEEAASDSGGRSGMGGGILYRWGNPQAYRAGGVEDQQLFVQHDAQWITPGLPGEGHLLMFNNGFGRPGDILYSSIEEIIPPVDSSGGYPLTPGEAYGPAEPVWSYSDGPEFFSFVISGVGRLPNGNTLITSGGPGTIFEVTPDGETVWKYVNPIEAAGPLTQGDPIEITQLVIGSNQVFRAYRYAPDYPGLAGRDLTPGAPLEIVLDSDDDGLFDHEESKIYDTDPFTADTDLDGLSDGDEVLTYGSDPLRVDTDLDGLSDGDEVLIYGSDPSLADTDGDGFSDGAEILIYGTDPLRAERLGDRLGDVNCDGDVSSIDAALVLQLTAGVLAFLFCGDFGDVDGDGNVTSIDAAIILQFTAGLIEPLPP
ncbi:MAG: aryl-sulfate sulfotransferase [Chloroflexi bacterium]|nr:aryl-sulfate sulfotransferase [Chloroflexota bacterium]